MKNYTAVYRCIVCNDIVVSDTEYEVRSECELQLLKVDLSNREAPLHKHEDGILGLTELVGFLLTGESEE